MNPRIDPILLSWLGTSIALKHWTPYSEGRLLSHLRLAGRSFAPHSTTQDVWTLVYTSWYTQCVMRRPSLHLLLASQYIWREKGRAEQKTAETPQPGLRRFRNTSLRRTGASGSLMRHRAVLCYYDAGRYDGGKGAAERGSLSGRLAQVKVYWRYAMC